MGKITKINCDLDNEQLTKKIKETKGFWRVQKWLIVKFHKVVDENLDFYFVTKIRFYTKLRS